MCRVSRNPRFWFPVVAALLLRAPLDVLAAETLQRQAQAALDGDTLSLAGEGELRLIGIRAPKGGARGDARDRVWAERAQTLLQGLAAGKTLSLELGETSRDRRGRILAQATAADGAWLQGALLEAGLARVETFADNHARAAEMLAIEAAAREAGRGLWSDPRYRVVTAAEAERLVEGYYLVEGRVQRVVERRDRYYLDFGQDWRRDFSVAIWKRDRARFRAQGMDPPELANAALRVRGWVRMLHGPMIEASHPEQIERLP